MRVLLGFATHDTVGSRGRACLVLLSLFLTLRIRGDSVNRAPAAVNCGAKAHARDRSAHLRPARTRPRAAQPRLLPLRIPCANGTASVGLRTHYGGTPMGMADSCPAHATQPQPPFVTHVT